jgi:hypothetical protein
MKHISFILGAGFSEPAKYPLRKELNEKLNSIKNNDIFLNTALNAGFLNSKIDPNSWANSNEKLFTQKFIEFYNKNNKEFDYEDFYDYYQSLINDSKKPEDYKIFYRKFLKEINKMNEYEDSDNFLHYFDLIYYQLLAEALGVKWPEEVSCSNSCFPKYLSFLKLIEYCKQKNFVHIHTLNHDLLIEKLSHTDAFSSDFCDGYTEMKSPFYGILTLSTKDAGNVKEYKYTVRLRYFNNYYPKKICFYKLHGSLDNYIFNDKSIKIKRGISTDKLLKEICTSNGVIHYDESTFNHYPDFLSGNIYKTKKYNTNHYNKIFNHFGNNLRNSRILIIIGYSFSDTVINKYIKKHFGNNKKSNMLIIDVKYNNNMNEFLKCSNVEFIKKGISKITLEEIDKILNLNIKKYFLETEKDKTDLINKIFV